MYPYNTKKTGNEKLDQMIETAKATMQVASDFDRQEIRAAIFEAIQKNSTQPLEWALGL